MGYLMEILIPGLSLWESMVVIFLICLFLFFFYRASGKIFQRRFAQKPQIFSLYKSVSPKQEYFWGALLVIIACVLLFITDFASMFLAVAKTGRMYGITLGHISKLMCYCTPYFFVFYWVLKNQKVGDIKGYIASYFMIYVYLFAFTLN